MVYKQLIFPRLKTRPFFYTNFVSTIDGKVWINKNGYWPLGSKTDYETFTYIRAHSDAIIDGKNTALRFGKNTIDTINSKKFKNLRKKLGKKEDPKYFVITRHPDNNLKRALENSFGFKPTIFSGSIKQLVQLLQKENLKHVFIDGGPQLLASLFKEGLIDEVFLTIAPKIIGNEQNKTLTMVEGILFKPSQIKNFKLVSVIPHKNEIYLRYKVSKLLIADLGEDV